MNTGKSLKLIEKLAKFGNPKTYPQSLGLPRNQTANMTFSGVKSTFFRLIYNDQINTQDNPSEAMKAKSLDTLTFLKVVDLCASA
jgi:tRNA A37 threonylcarbamoyltransferase TsaD